jgi:Flp pilus assembly pilin Flp
MKSANSKLSKVLKNLFREENEQVIEFFLLMALITFATTFAGLGMMSRVDTAFRSIGSTLSSYVR